MIEYFNSSGEKRKEKQKNKCESIQDIFYNLHREIVSCYNVNMKYDYTIVSRWRNKEQVIELVEKIRAKGKTVYSFIEGDGEAYELKDIEGALHPEEFMQHFEKRDWQTDPAIREVFEIDLQALKSATTCILLLPAGKSAHIEAGIAFGLGKECILIGEQKEAESLYLIFDKFYSTIDEFIQNL